MYWRNKHTASYLVRRNILFSKFRLDQIIFRCVFLQTSCCQVGSPREIYPQMHKEIINLTCMIFCSISTNYFIFLQRLSKNASVGMYRRAPPSYLRHCHCDWLNDTTWSHGNCRHVTFVYHVVWALPSHFRRTRLCVIGWTIPSDSTQIECCPKAICYVGCLMIANTWTYISLYLRNNAILENKKTICTFLHQLVSTCDLHLHAL